jgi:nicotinate dehydrogenase subunit B
MWPVIRRAAAAARETLIDLASQKWMVDALHHSGRRWQSDRRQPLRRIWRTDPRGEADSHHSRQRRAGAGDEWKIAGTSLPKVNARDIVTGAHKYTYDMKAPGMLHAKVLYLPSFGAALVSLDSRAAEAIPGVKVVHDGDFVGVTAPDPSPPKMRRRP